jgi:hypothetical protein
MKLFRAAATAFLAAAPLMAMAAGPVLVNFEKTWDFGIGDVNGYYGGGTAADGTSGANLGISFVNVSGLSSDALGPYYSGAPTPLGVAYGHDEHSYMNMSEWAIGTFSFFYSSPLAVTGAVKAYSGLNGTGTLLGSIDLAANADAYDAWSLATFAFSGSARSFDFSAAGVNSAVAFDNIAVTAIPEPSTVLLMLVGGAALLRAKTRRRACGRARLRTPRRRRVDASTLPPVGVGSDRSAAGLRLACDDRAS